MTEPSTEELKARVSWCEPGIILIREIPNPTSHSLQTMIDRANELRAQYNGKICMLIDLTESPPRPPSVRMRHVLQTWFHELQPNLLLLAFVIKKNRVMLVLAKFLTFSIKHQVQFFDSFDKAQQACQKQHT